MYTNINKYSFTIMYQFMCHEVHNLFYCTVVWKRVKYAVTGYCNMCFPSYSKGGNIYKLGTVDGIKRVFLFLD
jgi:hypothetical protein